MDGYPIDVTRKQIEAARAHVAGKLRGLIQEFNYTFQPGAIAGLMSDLRALDHITPMDAKDAGPVAGPSPDDGAAARQQKAERAHNASEEKRAKKAS